MTNANESMQCLAELIEPFMSDREGLPVHGVSMFPVYDGKETVLGREMEGMNKGLYHAFGGSAAKRSDPVGADTAKLAQVCYEEMQEELGICLEVDMLKNSFCGAFWVPFEDAKLGMMKTTLVIVLNLKGIPLDAWKEEYHARLSSFESSGLDRKMWWKWCEMDDVKSFPLDESLSGLEAVSSFVKENWGRVLQIYNQNAGRTTCVSAADLKWTRARAAGDTVEVSFVSKA